jgi:drug/metabolite transporter (DMT)-like permease
MKNFIQNKGIKLALLTALISGVSIFINKFAVGSITPPLTFTASKNLIVGILIVAILLISKKWKLIAKLNKVQLIKLTLIGLIGGALPFYLFFTGLSQIPAINAALIHKTLVIWVALLALPFLKEKLSSLQILAIGILFASNLLIGGFKGFTFSTGEIMVLVATILWAVENIIAKKVLAQVDPDLVVTARMGLGALVLVSATLIQNPQSLVQIVQLSSIQIFWLSLTAIALLGYTMSWYRALKHAPATLVASVLVISTLVTNILSAIFITHTWQISQSIQAGMLVLGVTLLVKASKVKIEEKVLV